MQRASAKPRALGRSIVELGAREPSLLNLPSPANSVPIVGPLVSPLLSNGAVGNTQPSTSPNPQPAPIPAAGSGGGGGDGGQNIPTPTASSTSGGGTVVPPEPTVPSPTSPTSASRNPSSSSSASRASGGGNTASSSSPGGSGNVMGNEGGQSAPLVNAGSVSSTTTSAALGTATPGVLAMSVSSLSQYSLGSGSNTADPASSSPTITTSAAASSGKQLSGAAIAGITIVCLFSLIVLILLVVRRRSMAGRVDSRRQWWFGHYGSGGNFSLVNNGNLRTPVASSGEAPASRLSARSSFATNFDQGLMLRADSPSRLSPGVVPDFPHMAEVRERNSILISTGGVITRRESTNSMLSNGSEPDAQYLTVSGQDNMEPPTPMSVRPFSSSESFVFPQPPAPPFSTADSSFFSGTQGPASRSSETLVHLSTPSRAFTTDLPPAPVSTPSLYPQTSTSSVSFSPLIAPATPSVDPFADPEKPGFADVEVIRRPFKASLDDELAVCPGDRVRLLQIFDDGWAFIEMLAGTEGERHERGLIPVDCLREASQALPTFLTQKRVSYGSEQLIATAL